MEFHVTKLKEITGGRMNKCHLIEIDNKLYFMKETTKHCNKSEIFVRESESLRILNELGVRVPKVIDVKDNYLILEYIEFSNQLQNESWVELAKLLSRLHSISNNLFGFHTDSFLGFIGLNNCYQLNWSDFFKSQRWKPIFDMLLSFDENLLHLWVIGLKVFDIMDKIFENIKIRPSLLHGDMNPGNWSIEKFTNQVVLYDSFCFYGHNWYDVAALICWKKLPNDFFRVYNETVPDELKIDLNHPAFLLYKAYIYLSGYFLDRNVVLIKRCEKLCNKLINLYPRIYPTLAQPLPQNTGYLLVQCGSYNPIHENHLRNLSIVRNFVNQTQITQSHCLLIPAAQSRIKQKVHNEPTFSFSQRINFIKDAVKHCSFPCSIDLCQLFGESLIHHLSFSYPFTKIVFVCGADTYSYNRRHIPKQFQFVVVSRNNYHISDKDLVRGDILLSNDGETTMSSTQIRKMLFDF
jgi:protein-ribulosamine 3-kinase